MHIFIVIQNAANFNPLFLVFTNILVAFPHLKICISLWKKNQAAEKIKKKVYKQLCVNLGFSILHCVRAGKEKA